VAAKHIPAFKPARSSGVTNPVKTAFLWGYSKVMRTTDYVIQWKSLVNGRAGRGTKHFDREEAERLAQELNREYPQIHHEAVKDEGPPTPGNIPEPELDESEELVTVE
jgi:hypothetical protein